MSLVMLASVLACSCFRAFITVTAIQGGDRTPIWSSRNDWYGPPYKPVSSGRLMECIGRRPVTLAAKPPGTTTPRICGPHTLLASCSADKHQLLVTEANSFEIRIALVFENARTRRGNPYKIVVNQCRLNVRKKLFLVSVSLGIVCLPAWPIFHLYEPSEEP